MADAFYRIVDEDPDGLVVESSPHTAGPWGPESQHAGPPSALLARACERHARREDMRMARVAVDVLGPVPIARLRVNVEVARPGRSVELLHARLVAEDRPVLAARVWRVRRTPDDLPAVTSPATMGPVPAEPQELVGPPGFRTEGYLSAVDWRFVEGAFGPPHPAKVWMRPLVALIDGEEITGWERALTCADSASGVSMALDPLEHPAINCDFSVALDRDPTGEWIGLDALTTVSPGGSGLCTTVLHDTTGRIGSGTQTLYVR